jgi:hypothetical protein
VTARLAVAVPAPWHSEAVYPKGVDSPSGLGPIVDVPRWWTPEVTQPAWLATEAALAHGWRFAAARGAP